MSLSWNIANNWGDFRECCGVSHRFVIANRADCYHLDSVAIAIKKMWRVDVSFGMKRRRKEIWTWPGKIQSWNRNRNGKEISREKCVVDIVVFQMSQSPSLVNVVSNAMQVKVHLASCWNQSIKIENFLNWCYQVWLSVDYSLS